jgi:hypothetical protein
MRKPSSKIILSALLALSWIGFLATAPRAQDSARQPRWEYDSCEIHELEEKGGNGWEPHAVTVSNRSNVSRFWLKKRI